MHLMYMPADFGADQIFARLGGVLRRFLLAGVLSFVAIKRCRDNIRDNRFLESCCWGPVDGVS